VKDYTENRAFVTTSLVSTLSLHYERSLQYSLHFEFHGPKWGPFLDAATLTEVFQCFFLGCKANARV